MALSDIYKDYIGYFCAMVESYGEYTIVIPKEKYFSASLATDLFVKSKQNMIYKIKDIDSDNMLLDGFIRHRNEPVLKDKIIRLSKCDITKL